jgi:hypothetical protein
MTHELVFMRDKTSLTVPSCPSSTGAQAIPLPDLLLQEAVVAFAPGVGGGLPLGGKDRDDSTDEAESAQLPQTAGMEPASRHAHVVVH